MDFVIPLHRRNGTVRCVAVIDQADAAKIAGMRWYFDGMYPAARVDGVQTRLHRFLLEAPDGLEVDHLDGDRLNNRRANLRLVDHSTNLKNVPGRGGTSRYRGVSWDRHRSQWRAQAKLNFKAVFIGRFGTEEAAAQAVREFWSKVDDEAMSHKGVVMDSALASRGRR